MNKPVELIVSDMPADIREALIENARAQNLSVNDVAAGILSERYGVERASSKAPFTDVKRNGPMVFRVPAAVREAIQNEVVTSSGLVKVALAEHFGLPAPAVGRKAKDTPSS